MGLAYITSANPNNITKTYTSHDNNIINLTDLNLSESDHKLLSLGLKFIPSTHKLPKAEVEKALNKLIRRLYLYDFFGIDPNKTFTKTPFIAPSTWTPPLNKISQSTLALVEKLKNTTSDFLNQLPSTEEFYLNPNHRDNLGPELRRSLHQLKQNNQIVIKPADKGGNVCLLNRDNYINEAYRQLNNAKYYKTIHYEDKPKLIREINNQLLKIQDKGLINNRQLDYLKANRSDKPRYLYLLPKIHKPVSKWPSPHMPEGRPIVGNCASITRRVSDYIDSFLKPLATSHPSYIQDSFDFANKIRNQKINANWLLVTGDITALYTNMNIDRIIETIQGEMIKKPQQNRPDKELLGLLKLTLKNNTFEFNNKSYLQIHGTAMGTPDAPKQANIYLLEFDEKLRNGFHIKPLLFFRFLDDVFFLWPGTTKQLKDFENFLNNIIPDISITLNNNEHEIPFLDMIIYKDTADTDSGPITTLQTKIFFKPTDNHQLLHTKSFHPKHTQRGLLKSQLIRFKRLSSKKTDYDKSCKTLFQALNKRGYSKRLLRKYKQEVWSNTTTSRKATTNKNKQLLLPLIIKYSPISFKITKIWREVITSVPRFKELKIVAAFEKGRNLGELLAPSKLKPLRPPSP